jgi:hypothetical protein
MSLTIQDGYDERGRRHVISYCMLRVPLNLTRYGTGHPLPTHGENHTRMARFDLQDNHALYAFHDKSSNLDLIYASLSRVFLWDISSSFDSSGFFGVLTTQTYADSRLIGQQLS